MFKDNTIRKGVMKIIDAKIENAQKMHDDEVKVLDERLEKEIERLRTSNEVNKVNVADKHIQNILGKII